MLLSRSQAAPRPDAHKRRKKRSRRKKKPKLEDYIRKRDYTGAITLLEFHRKHAEKEDPELLLWLAYAYFHNGDPANALGIYKILEGMAGAPAAAVTTYMAVCYFFLGDYRAAHEAASRAPASGLQNRVMFHCAHKFGDEDALMRYHANLRDVLEDQMTLASMHYLRQHYSEAVDVFSRLLADSEGRHLAMHVYLAQCYYKLDYFDSSLDHLTLYLGVHPTSAIGINLKACNAFRLYDGRAAEAELRELEEAASPSFRYAQDLIAHNRVVFRGGDDALRVLPPLVGVLPEARLNLAIFHLRQGAEGIGPAYELMKDVDALSPQEYILKAVVNAAYGQLHSQEDSLEYARQLYETVGMSATECDTIPGRQAMASSLILSGNYKLACTYLASIQAYAVDDDAFFHNYGVALAACSRFAEAEEMLLLVQDERIRSEFCYQAWLARTYIMNGRPTLAMGVFQRSESAGGDGFHLLSLIANDAYTMGHFMVAAEAFSILERTDPSPEMWDAKRGACIGAFQQVIAGSQPPEKLSAVVNLLRQTPNNPQVELIVRTMLKWASENGVHVSA